MRAENRSAAGVWLQYGIVCSCARCTYVRIRHVWSAIICIHTMTLQKDWLTTVCSAAVRVEFFYSSPARMHGCKLQCKRPRSRVEHMGCGRVGVCIIFELQSCPTHCTVCSPYQADLEMKTSGGEMRLHMPPPQAHTTR